MSSDSLRHERCKPCEGGIDPLSHERIARLLPQVKGWEATANQTAIRKRYEFPGFQKTMAFINALAWIANQQGHHPDFTAGSYHCEVTFTTHAIGGLSENDFICAARLDALVEQPL